MPCVSDTMGTRWLQMHSQSKMTRGNKKLISNTLNNVLYSFPKLPEVLTSVQFFSPHDHLGIDGPNMTDFCD